MRQKVQKKNLNFTIKDIVENIKKGDELTNKEYNKEIEIQRRAYYVNSIIVKPYYQREYRYSVDDESYLIESIFLDIPIPPIFLVASTYRGVPVYQVVDGQHRLRAIYRFCDNLFKLQNLPILQDLNGKKYEDIDNSEQLEFLSVPLSLIAFEDLPGKDYELEIFNRYNKGTKTLTQQEIRNAVYSSEYNNYVSGFARNLYYHYADDILGQVYNVTNDRFLKQRVQEAIFTIISILEDGIDITCKDSTSYAEKYMKKKAQKDKDVSIGWTLDKVTSVFEKFNEWITNNMMEETKNPFSRELYGISSKVYKFQIPIAMILAAIYRKFFILSDKIIDNQKLYMHLKEELQKSYIEDSTYTASSTNSKKIKEFVENFNID